MLSSCHVRSRIIYCSCTYQSNAAIGQKNVASPRLVDFRLDTLARGNSKHHFDDFVLFFFEPAVGGFFDGISLRGSRQIRFGVSDRFRSRDFDDHSLSQLKMHVFHVVTTMTKFQHWHQQLN